jgi:hypothetical protein
MEGEIIPQSGGPELSDAQMDGLLDGSIDSAPDATTAPAQTQSTPTPSPAPQTPLEYEIQRAGETLKVAANDPRVKQWLQQGYAFNQNMAEVNKAKTLLAEREKAAQALEERFKTVDEYVRQNPEWWNHVQSQWEARGQANDPNNPFAQAISKVTSELNELKEFKKSVVEERTLQRQQAEDQALATEIKSLQEQYPDLDLAAADATGQTLEFRVLEHANKNGISSFRAAFRDYLHDHLVTREAEKAKEAFAKDLQAKKSQGLLGTTPTPVKGIKGAENVRNKTYEQLMTEGMDELLASG